MSMPTLLSSTFWVTLGGPLSRWMATTYRMSVHTHVHTHVLTQVYTYVDTHICANVCTQNSEWITP